MDPSECPGGSVVSLTDKGHWGWEQSRQGTYPGVGVEELLSGAGWGRAAPGTGANLRQTGFAPRAGPTRACGFLLVNTIWGHSFTRTVKM